MKWMLSLGGKVCINLLFIRMPKEDILQITEYITEELLNPSAARNFRRNLEKVLVRIRDYPYLYTIYHFHKKVDKEYRFSVIGNYLLFYYFDEAEKTINVTNVVYSKRDFTNKILSMNYQNDCL